MNHIYKISGSNLQQLIDYLIDRENSLILSELKYVILDQLVDCLLLPLTEYRISISCFNQSKLIRQLCNDLHLSYEREGETT